MTATHNGKSHAEYMRSYRKFRKQKARVNREHTIEALRGSLNALSQAIPLSPMRNVKHLHMARTGVLRALQVLEDGIDL